MASILELHGGFSVPGRAFVNKAVARKTADKIYAILARRFKDFPAAALKVSGSRHEGFIEFPRIQHIWSPKGAATLEIAAEIQYLVTEFDTIYERVDAND